MSRLIISIFCFILATSGCSNKAGTSKITDDNTRPNPPAKPNPLPITTATFKEVHVKVFLSTGDDYCKKMMELRTEFNKQESSLDGTIKQHVQKELTLASNFCDENNAYQPYTAKDNLASANELVIANKVALKNAVYYAKAAALEMKAPAIAAYLSYLLKNCDEIETVKLGQLLNQIISEINAQGSNAMHQYVNFEDWAGSLNDWYRSNTRIRS